MNAPRLTPHRLVGRAGELERLVSAAAHPSGLIVITGEAGVGKTRLVTELLNADTLHNRLPLAGGCVESPDPAPLTPLIEALSHLPGHALIGAPPLTAALAPLLPELAGILPPPPAPLGDPPAERHRQVRAAQALLAHLPPAVLVLEDLHWADAATREFVRLLTARLPRELTVILTHRGDTEHPAPFHTLYSRLPGALLHETRLHPLTAAESGEFAAELLGADAVSYAFAEQLHRRTGGLPFAIEEVMRLVTTDTRDPLTDGETIEKAGLPTPVRNVLLNRLNNLSPTARAMVHATAVAARPVTADLLADITAFSEPDARRGLSLAVEHAVLHPTAAGTFEFRHSLARQAAYESICLPERGVLHLRTAKALLHHTAPLPLAQIARHYQQAGRTEQYLRYTEAAGDRAEAQGDAIAAAEHFRTALQDHPSPRARIRIGLKLGSAAIAAMPHDGTVQALRRLLTDNNASRAVRGELRLYLGTLMRKQAGLGLEGMNEMARAVRDLVADAPELAARALSSIAIPSLKGWPLAQHLDCLDQAQHLVSRVEDPVQRTAIATNRATVLMLTGDPTAWQAAAALPQNPESPAEEVQLARGYGNLAHATIALGHPEPARRYLTQATEILERNGIPYLEGLAETAHLLLSWTTGDWDGLAQRTEQALALYADVPDLAAETLLVRGLLLLHAQGDTTNARHDLLRAAHTTQLDTGVVLTASAAGLARIHLAAGRPDHARVAVDDALHHIRRTDGWICATDIAPTAIEALTSSGDHDDAAQLAHDFHHGVIGRDAPAAEAALLTCQALVTEAAGNAEGAAQEFAAAEAAWRQAGRPYETARALEARSRCTLTHNLVEGKAHMGEAIGIYRHTGATWDVDRCRRQLRGHGITLTQRRGPLGYGDRLSPRESEVALLVAQGATNRDIAATLHVSHRTIEQHVAKAIRKLGVSRRTELAALMLR